MPLRIIKRPPSYRDPVSVRLPWRERDRLYQLAQDQGVSVSSIVKDALRHYAATVNVHLKVNSKVEYIPQSPQHGWRRKERLATGRFVQDTGSAQNPASEPPKPKDEGFKD